MPPPGNDPLRKYKSTQITTASQGQLILMMYDGIVKYLNICKSGFEIKKYDVVNNNIIKAQDIITELMLALRLDAGDIAKNLYSLYEYMNRRLIEANIKKNVEICDEILKIVEDLRSVWGQVIDKVAPQQEEPKFQQQQYKPTTYAKPKIPNNPNPNNIKPGGLNIQG
jgi:flagellar secretion chaperone FliS